LARKETAGRQTFEVETPHVFWVSSPNGFLKQKTKNH